MTDSRRLQELVDDEDIDGVLRLVDMNEIADTWLRYSRRSHESDQDPADDPDWWAVELWLTSAWWDDPDRHRVGLMALVERADTELLGIVGAGPLEMLVCDDESCLTWLEGQLRRSAPLREAMRHAWISGTISEESFLRIEAAAGTRLDNALRDAIEGRPPPATP